jgi:60 kDa SS-A/Ro ribonucleoprotein
MKDMPAYLCVALITWGETELFRKVFDRVIDNGKMLRNFIQIGRSGVLGKKINMSSGAVRKAINNWFASKSPEVIFKASIGNDPSMRDILRMARPKPENAKKASLYAYLKGAKLVDGNYVTTNKDGSVLYSNSYNDLPEIVKQYEEFKSTHKGEIPNVDFRMLDSVLNKEEAKKLWTSQAKNGNWQLLRMNLNNFAKYEVFKDQKLADSVAKKLKDAEQIRKAKAYPYQLLMAYGATESVPHVIREALQDAMEIAIENVPEINGQVYICVDTSGSMGSPVTGYRVGSSSKVRCIDVAALFAASLLRKNKSAELLPFDTSVHACKLNGRDTVMTNASVLARFGGGGTDCSCALRCLNEKKAIGDTVIFVSDNESWVDGNYRATGLMSEWNSYKKRNPKAKLICIDLTPRSNSQVNERKDILQVGGWSDEAFNVIASFANVNDSKNHWVDLIEKVEI